MKHKRNSVLLLLLATLVLRIPAFVNQADAQSASSGATKPVQAFSAILWTTTTLLSPAGKPSTFTRRTVYTRDASGNVRRELYQPTKGLQHDSTAPLERVLTGSTSAQAPPLVLSSKETLEQDADLGTLQLSGFPATGRRQIFQDASGQRTHTLETWFSPTLGLTVRMESRNARGDTAASDLSDLQLGNPVSPSAETAPVASPPIPPAESLPRPVYAHRSYGTRQARERSQSPRQHG